MVVRSGPIVTAGAALSHVDLMLWLVRRAGGPSLGDRCARFLVIDDRPSQARYVALEYLGTPVPNAVGVLAALSFWWVVIVAIGLLWERRRRRTAG